MTGAEFEGVDIDLLADYVGGALDGTADEERVARLVAGDEAWRAAYEALAPGMVAVGAALRELDPEPMPDDLAARLDAMFRTGAPAGPVSDAPQQVVASGEPELLGPVPAKVVDLAKARRLRRWAVPVTVAAAAVAFAGFGVNALITSPATDSSAAGSAVEQSGTLAETATTGSEVLRSDTDYTASTLAQAATADQMRAANSPGARESARPPQLSPDRETDGPPLDRLAGPDAVAACIQEITRSHAAGPLTVQFLDYARFNGSPALIVGFSAADGSWVWAVGPDCGTPGAGADELERVPVR